MAKIKALIYSGGAIHDGVGCGDAAQAILEADGRFKITRVNEDLDCLVAPKLDKFDVVVFYHTIGEITDAQLNGLTKFVESGKGFVGFHSAADSFRESPTYRAMVGGYFITHPAYRQYQVTVTDPEHPITKDLNEFFVTDEMYITTWDSRNNVLAQALWKDGTVPVVWTKDWGKGNVCWIALGHDPKACENENFHTLLTRAAVWAATPKPEKE